MEDVNNRRYLEVPEDALLNVTSPPCSPIPVDWMLRVEDAPYRMPDEFDLSGDVGWVEVKDGVLLNMASGNLYDKTQSEDSTLMFTRKGVYISNRLPNETVKRTLPPIIVDSYDSSL